MNSFIAVGSSPTTGVAFESGPTLYMAFGRCAAMICAIVFATSETCVPSSFPLNSMKVCSIAPYSSSAMLLPPFSSLQSFHILSFIFKPISINCVGFTKPGFNTHASIGRLLSCISNRKLPQKASMAH